MQVVSTGDVLLAVLRDFAEDLNPDLELAVNERQLHMLSTEPPSWLTFLAESDWWVKAMAAYAALYVAEIVKEAGKTTWSSRAKAIGAIVSAGNLIRTVASRVADLRDRLASRTQIGTGIPFPSEQYPSRLVISGEDSDLVALQFALFVFHLPGLQSLMEAELITRDTAITGVSLKLIDNGDLEIAWQDKSFTLQTRVLSLRDAG